MSLEKAKINGYIYDVISEEEFYKNPEICNQYTAIDGSDGYIYPIRNKNDNRPGFYPTGGLDFFIHPSTTESSIYSKQNVINFKDATTIREVIKAQQKLASEERTILTTIDNVFAPDISDNDSPEMQAMKQAILDKHIDLDKYEPRFGPNYNNDKRLLKKGAITFGKLRSICKALDMNATLIIEDAGPDVPNPIGRSIAVKLTDNGTVIEDAGGEES